MAKTIAVFFDCENVSAHCVKFVFKKLKKKGKIIVAQAFRDWSKESNWNREVIEQYAIEPVQVFGIPNKNSCDLKIQNAVFNVLERGVAKIIAIVSSDSDFRHIALEVRRRGLKMMIFGEPKAKPLLRASCDKFIELPMKEKKQAIEAADTKDVEAKKDAPQTETKLKSLEEKRQMLLSAITHCKKDSNGWCHIQNLVIYLKQNLALSRKSFGRSKWASVFDMYPQDLEYVKLGNGILIVRLRSVDTGVFINGSYGKLLSF